MAERNGAVGALDEAVETFLGVIATTVDG